MVTTHHPYPPRQASCRYVRRLMQSFLDGELPDHEAELVAHHLEDCVRCGVAADTYRHQVKATLGRLRPDLDVDALERLRAFAEQLSETNPRP